MGESTAPRKSPPLEGQKTTAIEHSGPTLNTSARHFALERAPARRGPNIKKGPGAQGLKLNHARGDAGAVAGGLLLEGVVVDDPALGAGLVADGAHDDEGHAVEISGLRDGAALHLAAQVAEGREDSLLLFRGRDELVAGDDAALEDLNVGGRRRPRRRTPPARAGTDRARSRRRPGGRALPSAGAASAAS